jgi:hypothetical protein
VFYRIELQRSELDKFKPKKEEASPFFKATILLYQR